MNPIQKFIGAKTITTGAGDVVVREVPIRHLDKLNQLLANTQGLTPAQLAVEQVKLFTGLPDDALDALSHAETIQIIETGLEVNAGFFVSFAESIRATSDRLQARVVAGVSSPSTSGSTKPSPAAG